MHQLSAVVRRFNETSCPPFYTHTAAYRARGPLQKKRLRKPRSFRSLIPAECMHERGYGVAVAPEPDTVITTVRMSPK